MPVNSNQVDILHFLIVSELSKVYGCVFHHILEKYGNLIEYNLLEARQSYCFLKANLANRKSSEN